MFMNWSNPRSTPVTSLFAFKATAAVVKNSSDWGYLQRLRQLNHGCTTEALVHEVLQLWGLHLGHVAAGAKRPRGLMH